MKETEKLKQAYEEYKSRNDIKEGDLVKWKPSLQNEDYKATSSEMWKETIFVVLKEYYPKNYQLGYYDTGEFKEINVHEKYLMPYRERTK